MSCLTDLLHELEYYAQDTLELLESIIGSEHALYIHVIECFIRIVHF